MSLGPTSQARSSAVANPGSLGLATALLAVAALSWLLVLRVSSAMSMSHPAPAPAFTEGAMFTAQWGVMMAAMMLPSAAPMIMLYRTVARRLSAEGDSVVPAGVFAAVYLLLWLLFGIPVYGAYVAVGAAAARWPSVGATSPYAVSAVLVLAGVYQLTEAKHVCLRNCESPLAFLMRRWRSGYAATLRLAAQHAGYCIGCCWGLMAILVAAGAMSIPWVVGITLVVFAEKVLPRGWRTARVVGVGLIVLGVAVALRPGLAGVIRGRALDMRAHPHPMDMGLGGPAGAARYG